MENRQSSPDRPAHTLRVDERAAERIAVDIYQRADKTGERITLGATPAPRTDTGQVRAQAVADH